MALRYNPWNEVVAHGTVSRQFSVVSCQLGQLGLSKLELMD